MIGHCTFALFRNRQQYANNKPSWHQLPRIFDGVRSGVAPVATGWKDDANHLQARFGNRKCSAQDCRNANTIAAQRHKT